MKTSKPKLVRITTVPLSLDKLLEGQLAFMQQHFEVIAIAADRPYLERIAQREGVRSFMVALTRKITPIKDLRAVYALYRFLKKEKVAIVHSHTPKAGIVAMLAAKLAGVEHRLHTVAGLPLMEASGFKRVILIAVERLTYRCATMVYPNSKGLNDFIIKEELSRPEKLKILGQGSSNGIDTQFFKPDLFSEAQNAQLKEKLGIGSSDFIFVFVGRLVADKGINELVTAFNEVHQKHPHSALVMVGPFEETLDPLQPETLSIIENHSAIHCVGYQDDVRPYYAFAKALTFPSYREGFPNVVMQAGAMGLPSIVSDINGCNEIVKEAINGLIVKPKDALSLKNAMMRLLEDPDLFTNLKDSSRAAITSLYERSIMHNAILKEYKSIM